MALSDLWTQAQINAAVRRELMDPTGTTGWSWSDIEINQYVVDWQNILQDRFEFVWGSATITSSGTATITQGTFTNTSYGTSTFTLTAVSTAMLRLGNVWFNGFRTPGRNKDELEIMERDWRAVQPGVPEVIYQDDINTVSFWPPPAANTTNTIVFEFPLVLTFAATTSTMQVPAWTRYSAVSYCLYRCYQRPGPQQDLVRADRYKKRLVRQGTVIRRIWDQHFPDKAPSLRIAGQYEGDILGIGQHNTLFQSWV